MNYSESEHMDVCKKKYIYIYIIVYLFYRVFTNYHEFYIQINNLNLNKKLTFKISKNEHFET